MATLNILVWITITLDLLDGVRSYSSAKYTWPLSYDNPTIEIRESMETNEVQGCLLSEGGTNPNLAYKASMLHANVESYIQLTVDTSNTFDDDFSISVTVSVVSSSGGTIFHYQQDGGGAAGEMSNIILWYNSTNTILEVYGRAGVSYGVLVAVYPFGVGAALSDWVTFIISLDLSKDEFTLYTDTELGKLKLSSSLTLGQPGVLRFGTSATGYPRPMFYGQVVCSNWHDSKVKQSDIPDLLAECAMDGWENENAPPRPTVDPASCGTGGGEFQLFQKDVSIDVSIATVSNYTLRSRIRCADMCQLQNTSCASFTFSKVTEDCRLYDLNYFGNLVTDSGSTYYTRRLTCC